MSVKDCPDCTHCGANPLQVWLDDRAFGPLSALGVLSWDQDLKPTFQYHPDWLKSPGSATFDPERRLSQEVSTPGLNIAVLMESRVARWAQGIYKRHRTIHAPGPVDAGPSLRVLPWLTERELLCTVPDLSRRGAFRFSPSTALNLPHTPSVVLSSAPPFSELQELQEAALVFDPGASGGASRDPNLVLAAINRVMEPALPFNRSCPRVCVRDLNDNLWLAKLVHSQQDFDWALTEALLFEMANEFGIELPASYVFSEPLATAKGLRHIFLHARTDRHGAQRLLTCSAEALFEPVMREQMSYLDVAEFLATQGCEAHREQDLHQLFKRVLFSVSTGLRAHTLRHIEMQLTTSGWRLGKAADLVPAPHLQEHTLLLDDESAAPDLDRVMNSAEYYGVSEQQARRYLTELSDVMVASCARATHLGIPASAQKDLFQLFQFG